MGRATISWLEGGKEVSMAIGHGWLISLAHPGLCSSSGVGRIFTLAAVYPLFRLRRGLLSRNAALLSDRRPLARARPFTPRPTYFTFLQAHGTRPATLH